MLYIFDTNVVLAYLKRSKIKDFVETEYRPFVFPNQPIISVVTVAEIRALALKNNWGKRRITTVENL